MRHKVVAIVGRPNVGKSALFNRITGKATAIVDDFPGLTRDRNYGLANWLGKEFLLVDTGGFVPDEHDTIVSQIRHQTELAVAEADVIVLVVDGRTPLDPAEITLAGKLRKAGKPVVLAVNKLDNEAQESDAHDFWSLGFGEPLPVSAVHSRGIDTLLDAVIRHIPDQPPVEENDLLIKVAIVGQPNVGKSSLVNKILGETRVLVSDIPGTTRDTVSSFFEYQGRSYQILDTAGLRSKKRISEAVERYAVVRALRTIEETNVVILMFDATQPLTDQDEHIAGYVHEAGRACILAINKWDLIEKDTHTSDEYIRILRKRLNFMDYAPIITISAKSGQRVGKLLELAAYVDEQHVMRFKTSLLNNALRDIIREHPEPTRHGKALKIKYISQTGVRPPAFALFVNDAKRMHFAYMRHLKNQMRARFGLEGTPIIMMVRGEKE